MDWKGSAELGAGTVPSGDPHNPPAIKHQNTHASSDQHGSPKPAVDHPAQASEQVPDHLASDPKEQMVISHIISSDLSPEAKAVAINQVRDNFARNERLDQGPEIN